jgi:hypothetical protein
MAEPKTPISGWTPPPSGDEAGSAASQRRSSRRAVAWLEGEPQLSVHTRVIDGDDGETIVFEIRNEGSEPVFFWETGLGLDDGTVQMVGMAIDETVNPGESHVWTESLPPLRRLLAGHRFVAVMAYVEVAGQGLHDVFLLFAGDWDER